jgi:predicted NUDIX family NTP pyrophosphohydrolase
MGTKAYRARRDTNEPAVIDALEKCGWRVWKLAQRGVPDLLCFKGGRMRLVEVKTCKGKLRQTQQWDAELKVAVLRSADEALDWSREQ